MRRPLKTPLTNSPPNPRLARVIEHIVSTTPPSQLFELYYWAQEPQLVKLFRGFATLEPNSQQALISLFELVRDGTSVSSRYGDRGELILEVRPPGEDASIHHYLLEDDDPLATRGPKSH
jgi:hypothetical protein